MSNLSVKSENENVEGKSDQKSVARAKHLTEGMQDIKADGKCVGAGGIEKRSEKNRPRRRMMEFHDFGRRSIGNQKLFARMGGKIVKDGRESRLRTFSKFQVEIERVMGFIGRK